MIEGVSTPDSVVAMVAITMDKDPVQDQDGGRVPAKKAMAKIAPAADDAMTKGVSTADKAVAKCAFTADEAVSKGASMADRAVSKGASTADEAVAQVASTADNAVSKGSRRARLRLRPVHGGREQDQGDDHPGRGTGHGRVHSGRKIENKSHTSTAQIEIQFV